MRIELIHEASAAGSLNVQPLVWDGELLPATDRTGGSYLGVGSLAAYGQRGAFITTAVMTPGMLRRLADFATRTADFIEARKSGQPAPCVCSAWGHGMARCTGIAADDSSMCRDCWTPEAGQSRLGMGHGS